MKNMGGMAIWVLATLLFIGFAETGAAVNPTLSNTYISPSNVPAGQSFTGYYVINNPNSNSMNVGLGLSIRRSGTYGEIVDTSNDLVISAAPGTNTYSRTFTVLSGTSAGSYDVAQAIWSGTPGTGTQYATSGWKSGVLTITANPTLSNTYISPSNVPAGQSFTGYYVINNPNSNSMNVGLGLSIRRSGTYGEIVDTSNDLVISAAPGTNTYSRTFTVPSGTSSGSYDVAQAIWSGTPGTGTQYATSGWKSGVLTVIDTTPPTISFLSHSNGQTLTTSTITVSGTASDNIALSKVEVKVGAGSWQLASGTTSWSAQVTLSSGSNTIYARATDTSGNIAEASVTVSYQQPPAFDFSVSVSPNSGSGAAGNALTPAGTVTLNLLSGSTQPVTLLLSGLPSNVGTHDLEGLPADTCSPTCSISFGIGTYSTAPLGTYSLTITGTGGGKTHSTAYALTVTQPPQQTITVNTNLASASFMISGTASYSGSGNSWGPATAPAGTYTITYGAVTGYNAPPSETKTLSAGGSITFSGTYTPIQTTGSVSISSSPSGASVYLDGSYQSTTPYTIDSVPAGSHTITLKLSGYQDWSTTVSVVAGQTNTVSAPLTRQGEMGISVSSMPSGARIYLDSIYQGKTPKDINDVSVGFHYIELKLDGYEPWSDTIGVKAGSTSYVSATLTAVVTETITPTITTPAPTDFPPSISLSKQTVDLNKNGQLDEGEKLVITYGANDDIRIKSIKLQLDGNMIDLRNNEGVYTVTTDALSVGEHSIVVEAIDTNGNKNKEEFKINAARAGPSVYFQKSRYEVNEGEDVNVVLSAVNPIGNPKMEALLILKPPGNGVSTYESDCKGYSGQCTGKFEIEPGDSVRSISVRMKAEKAGEYPIDAEVYYQFEGGQRSPTRYETLTLVVKPKTKPTTISTRTQIPMQKPVPGFGMVIGTSGLLLAILLKRKR